MTKLRLRRHDLIEIQLAIRLELLEELKGGLELTCHAVALDERGIGDAIRLHVALPTAVRMANALRTCLYHPVLDVDCIYVYVYYVHIYMYIHLLCILLRLL